MANSPTHLAQVLLASAARIESPLNGAGEDIPHVTNTGLAKGMHIIIDVTAIVTAPSVVFTIDAYDYASGKWYNLLTSAAVTSVSTVVLKVDPNLTAAANLITKDSLPYLTRVVATHANANSITYSVGANLVG